MTVDVVIIGGSGRSGSTLLLQLLGSTDQHCAVGEFSSLWQRSFVENRKCDCRRHFRDCPFWTEVVDRAFGGFDQVDVDEMQRLFEQTQRGWRFPSILRRGRRNSSFAADLAAYREALERLYQAIAEVSGTTTIIDSSKAPTHAATVQGIGSIRVSMIHLVRDPRAVAFSWQRKKLRTDVDESGRYMARKPPLSVTAHWVFNQLLTPVVTRRAERAELVRYEDLMQSPRSTLRALAGRLDLPADEFGFRSEHDVEIAGDHAMWGNPSRYHDGAVEVRIDDQWVDGLSRRDRVIVSVLTAPWLVRFGYLPARTLRGAVRASSGVRKA